MTTSNEAVKFRPDGAQFFLLRLIAREGRKPLAIKPRKIVPVDADHMAEWKVTPPKANWRRLRGAVPRKARQSPISSSRRNEKRRLESSDRKFWRKK